MVDGTYGSSRFAPPGQGIGQGHIVAPCWSPQSTISGATADLTSESSSSNFGGSVLLHLCSYLAAVAQGCSLMVTAGCALLDRRFLVSVAAERPPCTAKNMIHC